MCATTSLVLYAGEQVEYGPAAKCCAARAIPIPGRWITPRPTCTGPQRRCRRWPARCPGVSALGGDPGLPLRGALPATPARPARRSRRRLRSAPAAIGCRCICVRARLGASHADDGRLKPAQPRPAGGSAPARRRRRAVRWSSCRTSTLRYTARRGLLGRRKVHNVAVNRLVAQGPARRVRRHRGRKRQRQEFGGAPDRGRRAADQRQATDRRAGPSRAPRRCGSRANTCR